VCEGTEKEYKSRKIEWGGEGGEGDHLARVVEEERKGWINQLCDFRKGGRARNCYNWGGMDWSGKRAGKKRGDRGAGTPRDQGSFRGGQSVLTVNSVKMEKQAEEKRDEGRRKRAAGGLRGGAKRLPGGRPWRMLCRKPLCPHGKK